MKSFSIQAISHAGEGLRVSDYMLLTLELLLQKPSLTPKVLIPTERLMGYSQTCHPGCVIIPTDSNLPTVVITSCVIIHRLLTLSFHSRIRSRFYLYINKIPSEGFFFFLFSPVFILKISILLGRIQFSLFVIQILHLQLPLCLCLCSPWLFIYQAGFKFKVLDFSSSIVAFASGSIS